jgi:hypothetical protein
MTHRAADRLGRLIAGAALTTLETNYRLILDHEQRFARALAVRVVDKPQLSVWMVLIPIIFLHFMHRMQTFKAGIEACSREFLYTKKRALDLAFDIVRKDSQNRPAAAAPPEEGEEAGLDKTREVRGNQLKEIRLLAEHYLKLFKAGGDTYEALVKNAYRNRDLYSGFLNKLEQAEKEVNRAALHALSGPENLSEIASKIETGAKILREEEARAIFPQ